MEIRRFPLVPGGIKVPSGVVCLNVFEMPSIVTPFRVLALILFSGSLNSIQRVNASLDMNFCVVFVSSISTTLVSSLVKIILALIGGGLQVLVAHIMLNVIIVSIVMLFFINAMGRSDIFLKLELLKKSVSAVFLVIAVVFFDSPIALAMTGIFTTLISCFINAFPNKKLIGYSYFEQMRDILPSAIVAVLMLVCVMSLELLQIPTIALLVIQVLVGIVIYFTVSAVFRLAPFRILMKVLYDFLKKN